MNLTKTEKSIALIFGTILILVLMVLTKTGFTKIDDGYRGVMKSGTNYSMNVILPGYKFYIPFYQTMDVEPVRPILVNYSRTEYEKKDSELLNYEKPLMGRDGKGIPIGLALSIEIKAVGDKLPLMFKDDGDFKNSFYKKVLQVNREAVQKTISKFKVDTIMDHRTEVEKVLVDLLTKSYKRNGYFELISVNLKDIIIPKSLENKMMSVQEARQDALKSKELIVKAQNEAKAEAAKAQGIADRNRIEAQGKADAILMEATSQAKANDLINNSITKKLTDYKTKMLWNGELPKVSGSSGLIIDIGNVTK
jgi:regulator of protease activity HflC (stomatin/prohibitin superfamily)